ncbi:MAG: hypothetical protein CMM07_22380 [Rhodopirellula sp.]|nr:hypothetical protein [Rhodopirellula sp.]
MVETAVLSSSLDLAYLGSVVTAERSGNILVTCHELAWHLTVIQWVVCVCRTVVTLDALAVFGR